MRDATEKRAPDPVEEFPCVLSDLVGETQKGCPAGSNMTRLLLWLVVGEKGTSLERPPHSGVEALYVCGVHQGRPRRTIDNPHVAMLSDHECSELRSKRGPT